MRKTSTAAAHLLGAAALAVAGVTALPATGAHAATPNIDNAEITGRGGTYHEGPAGCSTVNTGTAKHQDLPAGRTTTHTFSDTAAVVNPNGVRTEIDQSSTGRGSYVADHGRLRSFRLDASGRIGVVAGAGQTCGTNTWVTSEQALNFTIDRAQWVTMSAFSSAETSLWVTGANPDYTVRFGTEGTTIGSRQSGVWLLPAGSYSLEAGLSWERYTPDGTALPKPVRAGSGSIRVELRDAGSAYSTASGSGRSYLTLGGLVSCADGRLPVAFRSNAGRVKSATFHVNNRRTRTVIRPKARATTTVGGLPRKHKATVQAVVVVDPPGSKRSAVVKVRRSYRACLHD